MKTAIITPGRDLNEILQHLTRIDSDFNPEVWPDVKDPASIEAALIWKAPDHILSLFNNLKLVCSFGAGVDHLIFRSAIPSDALITRLVDPALSKNVSKYCLMAILTHEKHLKSHIFNQKIKKWEWKDDLHRPVIGIMGMGVIGQQIAQDLHEFGYQVNGFSQSPKSIEGIHSYWGSDQLNVFLQSSNFVVNVMPLTDVTRGYFNNEFFGKCKSGTYFINLGRGHHIIDEDLIRAIDDGHISGATLDVFRQEPLPDTHPFWESDKITITPHIAGITTPKSAATQFYENYTRLKNGKPLINQVDRTRGY